MKVGYEKIAIFGQYLRNDKRQGHIHYAMQTGTVSKLSNGTISDDPE